jgi:hypothetical protein
MKLLDLFSGIGGFARGIEQAGIEMMGGQRLDCQVERQVLHKLAILSATKF